MNRDLAIRSIGISLLGMFVGFVLLFFSVNFGQRRAENWLGARGGASPEEYAVVVEQSISVFIVLGGVILAASLLWAVLLSVKYPEMIRNQQTNEQVNEQTKA
ncbi:hypothetical protein ACFOZY_06375 [Chungangia koreensis]|uniref:Uncharacterized protein n=1 Tax=Chungangia koreensis TaxID=752657 RepID=A0ABV8X713_9LACT